MTILGPFNQQDEAKLLDLVVGKLQEDTLDTFDWEEGEYQNLCGLLLHFQTHQRNLRRLGGLVEGHSWSPPPGMLDRSHATLPHLENYRYYIKDSSQVCPIIPRFCQYESLRELSLEDIYDTGKEMLEVLAGDVDLNSLRQLGLLPLFPGLNSLTVKRLDLYDAGVEWLVAVDIARLQVIRLLEGTDYDDFLDHMISVVGQSPRWETLEYLHRESGDDVEMILQELLRSRLRLRHLTICILGYYEDDKMRDWNGLIQNADTLETLSLHEANAAGEGTPVLWQRVWQVPDFREFCHKAQNLKHLAISMPEMVVGQKFSRGWKEWMQCICNLESLVTLNITNWPVASHPLSISDREYYHGVRACAEQIFEITWHYGDSDSEYHIGIVQHKPAVPDGVDSKSEAFNVPQGDRGSEGAIIQEGADEQDDDETNAMSEASKACGVRGMRGAHNLRYIGFGTTQLYARGDHEDQAVYERKWEEGADGRMARVVPVSKGHRVWEGTHFEVLNRTLHFRPMNRVDAVKQARKEQGEERYRAYLKMNTEQGPIDPADLAI
ncbi:hypothetical protein BDZ85DRAFT_277583 [Elsinoe ampelina]|uniref:Uncharacterized protein n=1 Tax=Elsinoe ampelina TaxID=302913 RepID=A0A6A6GPM4_9PEZI|nr:hypothetical protein BDZ85DRAFT_277583 [Elsinoe ampelina]